MTNITFLPLTEFHFPLLLSWLEATHVKSWWDPDIKWTLPLINDKYGSYVKGYKIENGIQKEIHAYIICVDNKAIGYIQFYNAYDFSRNKPLLNLPCNLAAIDMFIGDQNSLRKGIGAQAIFDFLNHYCKHQYDHVFVDPDVNNIAAIKTYQKVGFTIIQEHIDTPEIWMVKTL